MNKIERMLTQKSYERSRKKGRSYPSYHQSTKRSQATPKISVSNTNLKKYLGVVCILMAIVLVLSQCGGKKKPTEENIRVPATIKETSIDLKGHKEEINTLQGNKPIMTEGGTKDTSLVPEEEGVSSTYPEYVQDLQVPKEEMRELWKWCDHNKIPKEQALGIWVIEKEK